MEITMIKVNRERLIKVNKQESQEKLETMKMTHKIIMVVNC